MSQTYKVFRDGQIIAEYEFGYSADARAMDLSNMSDGFYIVVKPSGDFMSAWYAGRCVMASIDRC